jgi:hypothetical protein
MRTAQVESRASSPVSDQAPALQVGEAFVEAIVDGRFGTVQRPFAPRARFRAITPGSVREATAARDARSVFENWFGDTEHRRLLQSSVRLVADRLVIDYCLRFREEGETRVAEQFGVAIVANGRIADLWLVCSGFRPALGTPS